MKEKPKKREKPFELLKRRFMTMNKIVRWLFGAAVAWVLLMDFWLVNITAKYQFLAVVGSLCRNLSFAYITAFIFYFFNVHLQNYKLKVRTFRYINNKCVNLEELSIALIMSLEESAKEEHSGYQKKAKQDIKKLCLKVHPLQPLKYGEFEIPFENYYVLFNYIDLETKRLFKDLLSVKDSLDSEMMMLLTFIENCTSQHLNYSSGIALANDNLNFYSKYIYQYRSLCKELTDCLNKNYEYYREEYYDFIIEKGRKEEAEKLEKQIEDRNKVS
ncbi:hypothetical protein BTA37_29420 [Priestia megaterium]|uniref:hypothetical protein n=1 Tax=Priestia megaterium TaxID=1404 RepID=UPI00094C8F15|nr:hypothetical protein [Priestia megaterium]OLO25282.1 hypothetical protein BTA37_29420 [Priestia megaterium]